MMSGFSPEIDAPQPTRSDGRSTRAQDRREKRRAEIIRAAVAVFAAQGYHEGSIADVIEKAEVSRGTFYLYFDGKRSLFDAILADVLEDLSRRLEPVDLDLPASAYDQLVANIERALDMLLGDRDASTILFRHAEGIDAGFDARISQFYDDALDLIESSLQTGMDMGILRPLNKRVGAISVLGTIKEVVIRALRSPLDPELTPQFLARTLLDMHLHGFLR